MQKSNLIPFPKRSAIDLGTHFCTVVGTPVIPPKPTQRIFNPLDLLNQGKQSWKPLVGIMTTALRAIGIPSDKLGEFYERGKTKGWERFLAKIKNEKNGRVEEILDVTRGRILVDTPEQILALADYFRPLNNSRTRKFQDSFSRPEERAPKPRRIKVVYELDNGHLAEIIISHREYDKTTKLTHNFYKESRKILDAHNGDVSKITGSQKDLFDYFELKRAVGNLQSLELFDLLCLEEKRKFFMCDRDKSGTLYYTPFMLVEREIGNLRIAVVPDPYTGFYRIDNSFLNLLDANNNPIDDTVVDITREDFLMESMTITHKYQNPNSPPLEFILPKRQHHLYIV